MAATFMVCTYWPMTNRWTAMTRGRAFSDALDDWRGASLAGLPAMMVDEATGLAVLPDEVRVYAREESRQLYEEALHDAEEHSPIRGVEL